MSDADAIYTRGTLSRTVYPVRLAYRGVLIERPCDICDTVNSHFEGRCDGGPCQFRYHDTLSQSSLLCGWTRRDHERSLSDHNWTPGTYYPADFEFACTCGTDRFVMDGEAKKHLHTRQCLRSTGEIAFHAILAKARELGEPEHYTIDLFRDYQKLTGKGNYARFGPPPVRFVWAIRRGSCGTDLFTPDLGIHEYYTSDPHRAYFLYDGETHGPLGDMPECNIHTARTVLATWRARELAMPGNHPFVEGCCFRPEEEHGQGFRLPSGGGNVRVEGCTGER